MSRPPTNEKRSGNLGPMIRVLRKQARMTQAELAKLAGLERTSITNIELGYQTLNVQTLNAIAAALGYSAHVTFRKLAEDDVTERIRQAVMHVNPDPLPRQNQPFPDLPIY